MNLSKKCSHTVFQVFIAILRYDICKRNIAQLQCKSTVSILGCSRLSVRALPEWFLRGVQFGTLPRSRSTRVPAGIRTRADALQRELITIWQTCGNTRRGRVDFPLAHSVRWSFWRRVTTSIAKLHRAVGWVSGPNAACCRSEWIRWVRFPRSQLISRVRLRSPHTLVHSQHTRRNEEAGRELTDIHDSQWGEGTRPLVVAGVLCVQSEHGGFLGITSFKVGGLCTV